MRRGQATVELALGSLLFVTVLAFGIHFGEAAMLGLKVQEAGAFALWDSTGRRVHGFVGGNASYAQYASLPATVKSQVERRYADFIGTGAPGAGLTKARTRGEALTARCELRPQLTFDVIDPGALRNPVLATLRGFYRPNQGGLTCQVDAEISAIHIPEFLEDPGGFANEQHVRRSSMTMCATRWCGGKLGILLGTWAIEGGVGHANNDEQPLLDDGTRNPTYYQMVKRLFDTNGKGEARPSRVRRFVTAISLDAVPNGYDEDSFWMSYRGDESRYSEPITGLYGHMPLVTNQTRNYDTNGAPLENDPDVWKWMNPNNRLQREPYFLGLPLHAP